jgi:hypothetical protein
MNTLNETEEKKEEVKKAFFDLVSFMSTKIIQSFWFIFALNTFFHTGFPYDFAHIISSWFFVTIVLKLVTNKQ